MNVLLARVRAHLRATDRLDADGPIHHGALLVDPGAYTATLDGSFIELRPREFELLVYMIRRCGKVVTRDHLLADLWDLHWETSTKTIDMHILGLRRKVGSAIDIVAIRGVGYRLELP